MHGARSARIEKELVDAELERERLEWEKTNATRKLREAITDAEWNAAAPKFDMAEIEMDLSSRNGNLMTAVN